MEAFFHLNVENWSGNDCFDWAHYITQEYNLNVDSSILNEFSRHTGKDLLEYGIDGFSNFIHETEGPKFYRLFREFIGKRNSVDVIGGTKPFWETFEESSSGFSDQRFSECLVLTPAFQNEPLISEKDENSNTLYSYLELTSETNSYTLNPNQRTDVRNTSDYNEPYPETCVPLDMVAGQLYYETHHPTKQLFSDSYPNEYGINACSEPGLNMDMDVFGASCSQQMMGMTLNDESSFEDEEEGPAKIKKRSTYRKDRQRSIKAWEYLLELLKDPRYNPSMIRWEDECNGVFRLIQKDVIALKWGQRKSKGRKKEGDMSSDSFAKVIRTYYAKDYKGKRVIENMPQNHVYKFGSEVMKDFKDGNL